MTATIHRHLSVVKSSGMPQGGKNKVGGENQIICITQAQEAPDRFRYTSYTDAAEDLSDTRIKSVFLTSWQEHHL